jgi:hypothetical protein
MQKSFNRKHYELFVHRSKQSSHLLNLRENLSYHHTGWEVGTLGGVGGRVDWPNMSWLAIRYPFIHDVGIHA